MVGPGNSGRSTVADRSWPKRGWGSFLRTSIVGMVDNHCIDVVVHVRFHC